MNSTHRPWLIAFLALALAAAAFCFPATSLAVDEPMTLRINDTAAEAGERVAVVLRTYAPRGVGQGQICLAARGARGAALPFVTLEEVVVFSELGDAIWIDTFDGPGQMALIEFESLSATINWADGPLAVLFFRLDASLSPGQEFDLELDLAGTFLIDAEGQEITLEPRAGVLSIRAPADPYELAAEGDAVPPGGIAALGVDTAELLAFGSGQVALEWDPALAAGPPAVTMDPRHGDATFVVDLTVPGRALVTFDSADGSLGEVPGKIISVDLPISPDATIGTSSPVILDAALTHLEDPGGAPIPLALPADVLEIVMPPVIFVDGFESGGLEEWSSTTLP